MLVGCRWPGHGSGHWVECGEADDRAGGDRSRRALMPAETGPVYLPAVLSLRLGGGLHRGDCRTDASDCITRSDMGPESTRVGATTSGCSHRQPGVWSRRRLRPWRYRGWSRLDSRLGHRLIGRAGGGVGSGIAGDGESIKVCDGETAFLAGSAAGGLPGRVPLMMFTGAGDGGGPASS